MTPEDRKDLAVRIFQMNKTMAVLRDHMEEAAEYAKSLDATELAFATYHLSDSIAVYVKAMNRYATQELQ